MQLYDLVSLSSDLTSRYPIFYKQVRFGDSQTYNHAIAKNAILVLNPTVKTSADMQFTPRLFNEASLEDKVTNFQNQTKHSINEDLSRVAQGWNVEIVGDEISRDVLQKWARFLGSFSGWDAHVFNRKSHYGSEYVKGFEKIENDRYVYVFKWDGKVEFC